MNLRTPHLLLLVPMFLIGAGCDAVSSDFSTSRQTEQAPAQSQPQTTIQASDRTASSSSSAAPESKPTTSSTPDAQNTPAEPTASTSTSEITAYRDFTRKEYDALLNAGKPILLSFASTDCRRCSDQHMELQGAYASNKDMGVNAFRVTFTASDSSTDAGKLAADFKIPGQHMLVLIGKDGKIKEQRADTQNRSELRAWLASIQ